ncbi:hypothetical protein [Lichenicoccus roseus]|nr:hypothetical protein [Lichenicoccus roseus]
MEQDENSPDLFAAIGVRVECAGTAIDRIMLAPDLLPIRRGIAVYV